MHVWVTPYDPGGKMWALQTLLFAKKRPKRAKDCRSFHLDLFNIITQAVSTSKKINCSSLLQPFGGWCTCTWFEILCLLFFWSTSFFFLSFLTKKCANFLAQRWSHDCCSRTNNKIWCRSYWSYYYHLRKNSSNGRRRKRCQTSQNGPKSAYKTGFGVGRVRRHRRVYHNEGHGLRDRLVHPPERGWRLAIFGSPQGSCTPGGRGGWGPRGGRRFVFQLEK